MGETLRADEVSTAEEIVTYLNEIGAIKKDRIEGLYDHFPKIEEMVNKRSEERLKVARAGFRGYFGWIVGRFHTLLHDESASNFTDCEYEICKVATKSLKELE